MEEIVYSEREYLLCLAFIEIEASYIETIIKSNSQLLIDSDVVKQDNVGQAFHMQVWSQGCPKRGAAEKRAKRDANKEKAYERPYSIYGKCCKNYVCC